MEEVYTSVEDKHIEPVKWFIDGDGAVIGIESTGKRFKITAVYLFEARDGELAHWRPVYKVDQLKKYLIN